MRLAAFAAVIFCAGSLSVHAAEQFTPTPRYYNGIGVSLSHVYRAGDRAKHVCEDGFEPGTNTYRFIKYFFADNFPGNIKAYAREGGPAARAGMRCGDVILSIDGREIRQFEDVSDYIKSQPAGTFFNLLIARPFLDRNNEEVKSYALVGVRVQSETLDRVYSTDPERNRLGGWSSGSWGWKIAYDFWFEETKESKRLNEGNKAVFDYSCQIRNEGRQTHVVHSPYLDIFPDGVTAFVLKPGQSKTFHVRGGIDVDGIPVETDFPTRVTDDWTSEMSRIRKQTAEGNAGISIDDDMFEMDGRWYVWQGVGLRCWLPERLARDVNTRVEAEFKNRD